LEPERNLALDALDEAPVNCAAITCSRSRLRAVRFCASRSRARMGALDGYQAIPGYGTIPSSDRFLVEIVIAEVGICLAHGGH
jgi:hypothetical protein